MKNLGIKTNNMTFICVLLRDNHIDLEYQGCKYFISKSHSHYVIPGLNHYTCIVDFRSSVRSPIG